MFWPIAGIIVATGLSAVRHWRARAIEREYASRYRFGADGIAEGAESFTLTGSNGKALLLLHGSGDSPQSLRYLGERLNRAGFTVHAPLLPGHGRSPRAFAQATADDYHRAARSALDDLAHTHAWVGVLGLSMGGAIAARLAEESSEVRALMLLAPYLVPPDDVRRAASMGTLLTIAAPYLRGASELSIHDRAASEASRAYGSFSGGALVALVETARAGRGALGRLTVPTLVINSERDNRISQASAKTALAEISAPVEEHWVTGCGHVITVDYCKDAVADYVLAFLARHAG